MADQAGGCRCSHSPSLGVGHASSCRSPALWLPLWSRCLWASVCPDAQVCSPFQGQATKGTASLAILTGPLSFLGSQAGEPDGNAPCLFFFKFFYLFMAVLGLRFCARAFSSCGERGPLLIAVRGPLTIAASLVAEHRLQTCRLSSCGSRA